MSVRPWPAIVCIQTVHPSCRRKASNGGRTSEQKPANGGSTSKAPIPPLWSPTQTMALGGVAFRWSHCRSCSCASAIVTRLLPCTSSGLKRQSTSNAMLGGRRPARPPNRSGRQNGVVLLSRWRIVLLSRSRIVLLSRRGVAPCCHRRHHRHRRLLRRRRPPRAGGGRRALRSRMRVGRGCRRHCRQSGRWSRTVRTRPRMTSCVVRPTTPTTIAGGGGGVAFSTATRPSRSENNPTILRVQNRFPGGHGNIMFRLLLILPR